jgi:hypothetical protein
MSDNTNDPYLTDEDIEQLEYERNELMAKNTIDYESTKERCVWDSFRRWFFRRIRIR